MFARTDGLLMTVCGEGTLTKAGRNCYEPKRKPCISPKLHLPEHGRPALCHGKEPWLLIIREEPSPICQNERPSTSKQCKGKGHSYQSRSHTSSKKKRWYPNLTGANDPPQVSSPAHLTGGDGCPPSRQIAKPET